MPYTSVIDVMLILTRQDQVLLALRQGTGYADGQWNLPSGKLEHGEHAIEAIIREAHEEIGIRLATEDLRLAGTVHYRNPEGEGRIGLFFATEHHPNQHGEPVNSEPEKCADIAWTSIDRLPANTVPYTAAGIDIYRTGTPFIPVGWTTDRHAVHHYVRSGR